jgi:hypothetical protein
LIDGRVVIADASSDGNKLQITFRTTLTKGTFNISVSHGGKPIFRSPFDLELSGLYAKLLSYPLLPRACIPPPNCSRIE